MQMLYDSDSFVVLHLQTPISMPGQSEPPAHAQMIAHGFEIVDKRSGKELYLTDSWAELFHQQLKSWQLKTPSQQEVEDALDKYSGLAQTPILVQ
jgi:hypothetical protein